MVVNGVSSDRVSVLSGVPQGSILGPLLFLIYINDLTDITFSEGSKLVLYADDILLYKPILSQDDFNALQTYVNLIQTWANSNNTTFNTTKCKGMNISRKRRPLFPLHPIQLGEFNLESVQEYHVANVCSKTRKIIALLYRKFSQHAGYAPLLWLYISLVRPHL